MIGQDRDATTWERIRDSPALDELRHLSDRVASMVADVPLPPERYPVLDDVDWLPRVLNRVSSTFTTVVIGQVSSGKSSFINSLLGRRLLISSDRPTDGVISVLLPLQAQEQAQEGEEYAELIDRRGRSRRLALPAGVRFLSQQETSRREQESVAEVRLHLGDPLLHRLRLVGTPGFGDRLESYEQVVLRYLRLEESDLVVWTFAPDAAANEDEMGISSRCPASPVSSAGSSANTTGSGQAMGCSTDPALHPR